MSASPLIVRLVNRVWIASCSREHARFTAALGEVAQTQSHYLLDLLKRNAETRFGRKHDFAGIRSVAEFQARVPVANYESFVSDIEAIAGGENGVLTRERVRRFQPTSGSLSATKLIPWTAGLAREFQRGIAPWLATLYRRRPELFRGASYWSVSPPGHAPRVYRRLPVGFGDDSEYLGGVGKRVFPLISCAPPDAACCGDVDEFAVRTLVSLLAEENLSLISIWSPTFLTILLEQFLKHPEELLGALMRHGSKSSQKRTAFLESIVHEGVGPDIFKRVWPRLRLISCWTHGPSDLYAKQLQRYFPGVEIQGKGLVSTEAFASLPFEQDKDPVLAVTSHFFEFQQADSGQFFLAHQLSKGRTYRLIVTTGGGLYRYSLGDLVQVTGFIQEAPCFRFVGREGNRSDLFGEKLQGAFVQETVRRVLNQHGVEARFFLVAPVVTIEHKTNYTLFIQANRISDIAGLEKSFEHSLSENFHYAHCRRLRQLGAGRVFQIDRSDTSPEWVFQETMRARGIRSGDIKMVPLDSNFGWEKRFKGKYVA